jgi:hypothetical protein
MSTRRRSKRELKGRRKGDSMKLHKFYGDLMNIIPLFEQD